METSPSRLRLTPPRLRGPDGVRAVARNFEKPVEQLASGLASSVVHCARRMVIILAVALLAAAALGGAIAIGSGRLSLPLDVDMPLFPSERVFEVALHYYT